MKEEQILKLLLEFKEYLKISDLLGNTFRKIGWWIVKGLMWASNSLADMLNQLTNLLGFGIGGSFKSIMSELKPLQGFFLLIGRLLVGFTLYFSEESGGKAVMLNIIMIIMVLSMLPSIIQTSVNLTNQVGKQLGIFKSDDKEKLGTQTVIDNVTDIYEFGKNGWTTVELDKPNHLTEEALEFFDVNEQITDPGAVDDKKGLLESKLANKTGGTGYAVVEMNPEDSIMDKLVLSLIGNYYYRWKVNFWQIFLTLIPLVGALVISLLRTGRLSIEIAFNHIWASFIGFWELRTLQRFKQTVMEIIIGFATLIAMFVMYALYIKYSEAVITNKFLGVGAQFFALFGGAWFIFDGPAIIQKTLGVDAGLDKAGAILGGLAVSGASKGVGALGNLAGSTVKGGASAVGFAQGLKDAFSEEKSNSPMSDETNSDLTDFMTPKDSENGSEEKGAKDTTEENQSDLSNEENDLSAASDDSSTDGSTDLPAAGDDSLADGSTDLPPKSDDDSLDDSEPREAGDTLDSDSQSDGKASSPMSDSDSLESSTHDDAGQEPPATEGGIDTGNDELTEKPKEPNVVSSQPSSDEKMTDTPSEGMDKDSSSKDRSSQFETSGSKKAEESTSSKNEDKLKNPLVERAIENAKTPKFQKDTAGPIGNTINRHASGRKLGQDFGHYLKERKESKETKNKN